MKKEKKKFQVTYYTKKKKKNEFIHSFSDPTATKKEE